MNLRPYRPSDVSALAELFYQTVHSVNRRDYTAAQCRVWATGHPDLSAWDASFQAHRTWIAEEDGHIVGFTDLDVEAGYLDRLYVHKDAQRRGVGTALCDAAEACARAAGVRRLETHASITARPFFAARGYTLLREQEVERDGILLKNYVMILEL